MNKILAGVFVLVAIISAGAAGMYYMRDTGMQNGTEIQVTDPGNTISRPNVRPTPNTFSIMTPQEQAAADEAARVAAETEVNATTTASTSAIEPASN